MITRFLTILIILVCSSEFMSGQGRWSDALLHEFTPRQQYIGIELGFGAWENEADFGVSDRGLPCSRFTDGDGSGPMAALKLFLFPIRQNNWFLLSPRFRYVARSGTFVTPLASEPILGENNERVILEHEAQVDATMASMDVELMFGVSFFGAYIVGGGSGGLLMNGFYDYTERILSPTELVYTATESNEQQLLGGRSFDSYNSLAFDLRGGLGYIFRINHRLAIGAEAMYSYPLTSALTDPDVLKQTGILGGLSFYYNFGDPEK